jgi:hypothetical protein
MEEFPMKIAIATAAALLAASSFAFAADNNGGNNGGKDGMKNDQTTTGSISDPSRPDMDDAQKCRDHVAGGAPCQEPGTTMDQ